MLQDETRLGIIEAAAAILRDQGARAVTTRAVAQAAGVQAPTIYRLFGDKDGLIDAVAEHVMAEYVTTKAAGTRQEDPLADLRAGWHTHLEFSLANPGLFALLNAPDRLGASPALAAGAEVLRRRVHRLAAAGLLRVDERRATTMIQAAGSGTVLALLSTPPADRDPDLADAMFDAVAARILTSAPPPSGTDQTAVAVAFATMIDDLPALTPAERALMTEWLTRSLQH